MGGGCKAPRNGPQEPHAWPFPSPRGQRGARSSVSDASAAMGLRRRGSAAGGLMDSELPAQEGIGLGIYNVPDVCGIACARVDDSDYVPTCS